jgi:hypothetical protein
MRASELQLVRGFNKHAHVAQVLPVGAGLLLIVLGAMLPTSQTLLTRSLFPHALNLAIELSHLVNF